MKSKNTTVADQPTIEQLKAENELKTKWLSLIAHDFKGFFSNIQLLLAALDNQSITPAIFMSMLPELRQMAQQNSKTIESTLAWVKSQTNGFNLHIEAVVVHHLYLALVKELDKELGAKEITFVFTGNNTLTINTDKLLLLFIVKQLIANAIKYSKKGGLVTLGVQSYNDKVTIAITDNGVGMPDSRLSTIGTLNGAPYTGTMQEKGAGLSLVVVKEFVEMLNGTMRVSSTQGVGTTVEIELKAQSTL